MAYKTILKTKHLEIKVMCVVDWIEIRIIDLKSKSENITTVDCYNRDEFVAFLEKIRLKGLKLGSGRFKQEHWFETIPNEVVTERVSATGRVDARGSMTYKFTYRSTLVDTDTKKTLYESRCAVVFSYHQAKGMAEALRKEILNCCKP